MSVQTTFVKHTTIKGYFEASINGFVYYVYKTQFGWHAAFGNENGFSHVDLLNYDNRGQAENACNIKATKLVIEQQ